MMGYLWGMLCSSGRRKHNHGRPDVILLCERAESRKESAEPFSIPLEAPRYFKIWRQHQVCKEEGVKGSK